jgi:hypothetical protein
MCTVHRTVGTVGSIGLNNDAPCYFMNTSFSKGLDPSPPPPSNTNGFFVAHDSLEATFLTAISLSPPLSSYTLCFEYTMITLYLMYLRSWQILAIYTRRVSHITSLKGTVSRDGYFFWRPKHFNQYLMCMRSKMVFFLKLVSNSKEKAKTLSVIFTSTKK